jgi:hypothetical protein
MEILTVEASMNAELVRKFFDLINGVIRTQNAEVPMSDASISLPPVILPGSA